MKFAKSFRLSTLLLFTAIVALAAGWFADRFSFERRLKTQQQEFDEKSDRLWSGVYTYADTRRLIYISHANKMREEHSDFEKYLEIDLVWAMTELWRNEKDIDAEWPDETPAITSGNDILKILDCESIEAFFDLAQAADGFNGENTELFPEIHDYSSPKHDAFSKFVERSLNAKNVTKWGQ